MASVTGSVIRVDEQELRSSRQRGANERGGDPQRHVRC